MADTLAHTLSVGLANKLNKYAYREGLEYKKVVLGAEILMINATKTAIVISLAIAFGVLLQTVIVLVGFNVLRRTAFGLHATTSVGCTLTSISLFVIIPFIIKDIKFNNFAIIIIFTCILFVMYLYAPSDTEARPILGEQNRKAFKKKSITNCLLFMLGILLIPNDCIKLMATIGATYEAICLLPFTYKILGRRRNNYEQYES